MISSATATQRSGDGPTELPLCIAAFPLVPIRLSVRERIRLAGIEEVDERIPLGLLECVENERCSVTLVPTSVLTHTTSLSRLRRHNLAPAPVARALDFCIGNRATSGFCPVVFAGLTTPDREVACLISVGGRRILRLLKIAMFWPEGAHFAGTPIVAH